METTSIFVDIYLFPLSEKNMFEALDAVLETSECAFKLIIVSYHSVPVTL
jgi:hypothetical protein